MELTITTLMTTKFTINALSLLVLQGKLVAALYAVLVITIRHVNVMTEHHFIAQRARQLFFVFKVSKLNMKKFLNNSSGFSLVEVMVGVGILTIGIFMFIKSMENRAVNKSQAQKATATRKIMEAINLALENESACKKTFKGKGTGAIINEVLDDNIVYFTQGEELADYKRMSIEEMKLGSIYDQNGDKFAVFHLKLKKPAFNKNRTPQILDKNIILKVFANNNKIITCSTGFLEEKNKQLSCDQIGGTYVKANAGIPAYCDHSFEKQSCLATGSQYNDATKKCVRTDKSFCDSIGGTWQNNRCTT